MSNLYENFTSKLSLDNIYIINVKYEDSFGGFTTIHIDFKCSENETWFYSPYKKELTYTSYDFENFKHTEYFLKLSDEQHSKVINKVSDIIYKKVKGE